MEQYHLFTNRDASLASEIDDSGFCGVRFASGSDEQLDHLLGITLTDLHI